MNKKKHEEEEEAVTEADWVLEKKKWEGNTHFDLFYFILYIVRLSYVADAAAVFVSISLSPSPSPPIPSSNNMYKLYHSNRFEFILNIHSLSLIPPVLPLAPAHFPHNVRILCVCVCGFLFCEKKATIREQQEKKKEKTHRRRRIRRWRSVTGTRRSVKHEKKSIK